MLDLSASHDFQDAPLVEVIRVLSETHNIPIILDARALESLGLSVEEPVSISLENVALRSFLRLMLGGLDASNLTYMVKDEVLKITSKEAAEQSLRVGAYRLDNALADQAEQVIAALQKTVNPSEWTTEGGAASAAPILGNVIVVSATETLHEQVQDFLEKVQSALEE